MLSIVFVNIPAGLRLHSRLSSCVVLLARRSNTSMPLVQRSRFNFVASLNGTPREPKGHYTTRKSSQFV